MPAFYEKVRVIRMMRGIKQAEIANLLSVKQQSVSKIENGKIQIDVEIADKIARYLGFDGKDELDDYFETVVQKKWTPEKKDRTQRV